MVAYSKVRTKQNALYSVVVCTSAATTALAVALVVAALCWLPGFLFHTV